MIRGLIKRKYVEIIKNQLPENGTVLDIGTGVGIPSYQLYHQNKKLKFSGIDKESKVKLEKIAVSLIGDDPYLEQLYTDRGRLKLYEIYEHVTRTIFNAEPIDKTNFRNTFGFQFKQDWVQYLTNQKLKFDLIIMSNILHYGDFTDHNFVFERVNSKLNDNGLIYITSPTDSDRNKIFPKQLEINFKKYFYCLTKISFNRKEKRITIVGQRK